MNPIHDYQPVTIEMVQFSPDQLIPEQGLKVSDVAKKLFPVIVKETYLDPSNASKVSLLNQVARVQRNALSIFLPMHLFGIGFCFLFFVRKELFYFIEGLAGLFSFFCFTYYCVALTVHSVTIAKLKKMAEGNAHAWIDENEDELLTGNYLSKTLPHLDEVEMSALNTTQIFEAYPESWDEIIQFHRAGGFTPQQRKWIREVWRYRSLGLHHFSFRDLIISYIDKRKKFAEKVKKYPEILIAIEKDHPNQIVRSKIFALRNELGIGRPETTEEPLSIIIESDPPSEEEQEEEPCRAASSVQETPEVSPLSGEKKNFIIVIDSEGKKTEVYPNELFLSSPVIKKIYERNKENCQIHIQVPFKRLIEAYELQKVVLSVVRKENFPYLENIHVIWEVCSEYLLERAALHCLLLILNDIETIDLTFFKGKHYPPIYLNGKENWTHAFAEVIFKKASSILITSKNPVLVLEKITLLFEALNIVTGPYHILHNVLSTRENELSNTPFDFEKYQSSLKLLQLYHGTHYSYLSVKLEEQFEKHLNKNFALTWERAVNTHNAELKTKIAEYALSPKGKETLKAVTRVNPTWFVIPDELDAEMNLLKVKRSL